MCLIISTRRSWRWPSYDKNYAVFWKRFTKNKNLYRGYYITNYTYNDGWNYPTTLKIRKTSYYYPNKKIHDIGAGCIHVYRSRQQGEYPVICQKTDLIAVGQDDDLAFKKVYVPINSLYSNKEFKKLTEIEILNSVKYFLTL